MSMPSLLLEHDAYSPQVLEQATHIINLNWLRVQIATNGRRNVESPTHERLQGAIPGTNNAYCRASLH